ncbi:MAG: hypothetical protein M3Y41_00115, partial [Pseudomonadota bacterium]|nr:hypothetical protein [Pseudomonadota bacterium]
AASFEPDDNPLGDNVAAASASSATLSTGLLPGEWSRRRNTYEAAVRYQGSFGPTGIYAFGGYIGSGRVNPGVGAVGADGTAVGVTRYDNMGAWNGGVAVTVAGFRVGGSIFTGAVNNQLALKPDGGKNMIAYLVGTQYSIGPLIVGASYMNILSAGAVSATGGLLASQRREGGINVGGTYVIAPGLLGWLSASYGQRYQGGYNFNSTALDTATSAGAGNNVHFEAVAIGGAVKW